MLHKDILHQDMAVFSCWAFPAADLKNGFYNLTQ